MAIAYGATSTLGNGTGTRSWSHGASGSPAGAVVFISGGGVAETTDVTYGGVSMTRIETWANTAGESGTTSLWYISGQTLSGGTQTVQVVRSGSTAYIATCYSFTSATNASHIVALDGNVSTNTSDLATSLTIPSGEVVFIAGGWYSGENAVSSVVDKTDQTSAQKVDFGNFTGGSSRRTALYTGTGAALTTFGWTQSADDGAWGAVAIAEFNPPAPVTLVVADTTHAHQVDNVVVTAHEPGTPIVPADTTHALTIDQVSLTQHVSVAPVLVDSATTNWTLASQPRAATSGVDWQVGDVIVVKLTTAAQNAGWTVYDTNDYLSFTTIRNISANDGGHSGAGAFYAVATDTRTNQTINATYGTGSPWGFTVEVWRNVVSVEVATLAYGENTNATNDFDNVDITTQYDNSAVSFVMGDWIASNLTPTWINNPTILESGHLDGQYDWAVGYYPNAGAAGAFTVGASTDTWVSTILAFELHGSGVPSLEIQDTTHAQIIDNVSVTQHTSIVPNDSTHAMVIDNVAITQHYNISVNDVTHASLIDNVSVTPHAPPPVALVAQDQTHGFIIDNVALTQHGSLVVSDTTHATLLDNVVVTYVPPPPTPIFVQDSTTGLAVDNVVLTQHSALVANDMTHSTTLDAPSLIQHSIVAVADTTHATLIDSVTVTYNPPPPTTLTIQDSTHAFLVDSTRTHIVGSFDSVFSNEFSAITGANVLGIQDIVHGFTADSISLVQHNALSTNDLAHSFLVDQVTLLQNYNLVVDGLAHTFTVDSTALTQHIAISIDDVSHGHFVDSVGLVQHSVMVASDVTHALVIDPVSLTQHSALAIDQLTYSMAVDGVVVTQHSTLSILDTTTQFIVDNVNVLSGGSIGIHDTTHSVVLDNVSVTQHNVAVVHDTTIPMVVDNVGLTQHVSVSVDPLTYALTIDPVSVVQHNTLSIAEPLHSMFVDSTTVTQHNTLSTNDLTVAIVLDQPALTQHTFVLVADTTHATSTDLVTLVQHSALTVDDTLHAMFIDNIFSLSGLTAKIWNGTSWKSGIKVWNGTSYRTDAKVWNGTQWIRM